MTTVGRIYRFRATHSLAEFPEPWCCPHQHDYTVEVVTEGGTPTDELDERWAQILPRLEGQDLNGEFRPSTVEHIAETLRSLFGALSVTVWEDRARWGKAER